MRQRMSRTHKNRRGFKVDSILERVMRNQSTTQLSGYMTLTFLGFYDKKGLYDFIKNVSVCVHVCEH